MNSEYLELAKEVHELEEAIEAIHPLIADIKELLEVETDPEPKAPKQFTCEIDCKCCIDPGTDCPNYRV